MKLFHDICQIPIGKCIAGMKTTVFPDIHPPFPQNHRNILSVPVVLPDVPWKAVRQYLAGFPVKMHQRQHPGSLCPVHNLSGRPCPLKVQKIK